MNYSRIPTISVVMSIYSEPEAWLRESIESVLNQTFTDFEFIIINDNPRHKLNADLLLGYKNEDKRIIIITNSENIGLTKSLNKGLKSAKGKYIARMDGDDISLPERFKKQVKLMESNPEIIVSGTLIEYFGLSNRRSTDWIHENHDEITLQLMLSTCMAHPTTMIRREILIDKNIQYDEDYIQAQDLKLWFDLKDFGKFYNIKDVLLKYRISKNQVSTSNKVNQNLYAKKLRRKLIVDFLKKTTGKEIEIPKIITLDFLKEIKSKEKEIYNKFPHLKTDYYYSFFTNIIISTYLSINHNNIRIFAYYLYSLDILRTGSQINNILRIVEKRIFPQKKQARI